MGAGSREQGALEENNFPAEDLFARVLGWPAGEGNLPAAA